MSNMGWIRVVEAALVVALAGCIASKQYTLKLDPTAPNNNQLCERASDQPAGAPATCRPVTAATLDGSSTLAVELDNADPERTYTAQIEQATLNAAGDTPPAVIAEVINRFGSIVKTVAGKDASPAGLLQSDATAKLETGLRAVGLTRIAGTLVGLREASRPAADEEFVVDATWIIRPDPGTTDAGAKFRTAKDVIARDQNKDPPLFGAPWSVPPGRDRPLSAAVLDRLVARGFARATVDAELVRHIIDVCSEFGAEPYDGKATPWQDYLETIEFDSLRGPDVLHDIGIDAGKLYEFMRGKDASVLRLLREARTAAKRAFESGGRPTPAQQVIHLLYATSALYGDAMVCSQNIDFAAALTSDAALTGKLAAARATAARIVAAARIGRDLFHAFVDPMVTRAVIDALRAGGNSHVTFGAISLKPGTVNVNVSDGGAPPKQVASYEFRVATAGAIAISIGPMVGMCSTCYETMAEEIRPGDGAAVPEARLLRRDRRGFGAGVATMVQVPLVARSWFEFGPTIGYPISEINGTSRAVLAGVSLGHRAGISLSLGVHLFGTRRLKDGYGAVIDTSQPGLTALTAESVTTPTYAAAFFMSLNISTALLGRAGSGAPND